jgi:hypothetical protein
MFTEIAVQRNGVQMAFQAGQNARITQKVAWSVSKAHDIMARYKRHAYKDDPTVASELVKFLAINSFWQSTLESRPSKGSSPRWRSRRVKGQPSRERQRQLRGRLARRSTKLMNSRKWWTLWQSVWEGWSPERARWAVRLETS